MSSLLFTLLVLGQQSPAHAELHPRDADLFVEASDVAGALDAYRAAPLLRFLRDEQVEDLAAQLGVSREAQSETPVRDAIVRLTRGFVAPELVPSLVRFSFSVTRPATDDGGYAGMLLVLDMASEDAATIVLERVLANTSEQQGVEASLESAAVFRMEPVTIPLWTGRDGARVFVGGGAMSPTDLAALRSDASTSFASNANMTRAAATFDAPVGATLFWLAQTQNAARTLRELDANVSLFGGTLEPLDTLPPLPFDPLGGPRVVRMQLFESQFVSEVFTPRTADATAHAGVDAKSLDRAPQGAMVVWAANSIDGFVEAFVASLATSGASEANLAAMRRVGTMLGPNAQGYALPISGLGLPKLFAWFDVTGDASAMQAQLIDACNALGEALPGVSARTRAYNVRNRESGDRREFEVTTITVPTELLVFGPLFSISPAFAVVDDKLLVGLRSTELKAELKRLFGGRDDGGQPTALLEAFEAQNAKVAEGAAAPSMVVLVDWNAQVRAALGLVETFGPLLGDSAAALKNVPPASVFERYFGPTVHIARPAAGGSYARHTASFGPETWLALARGLLAFFDPSTVALPTPAAAVPTDDEG